MLVTSNEANKLLKTYQEDLFRLLTVERSSSTFTAALSENIDDARPVYNFIETQNSIVEINEKIRKIKHAINVFNTTTIIPETNLTIDEALVFMPQLSKHISKLVEMKNALPKTRVNSNYSKSNLIEYSYANYEIKDAAKAHEDARITLIRLQTALDTLNNTVKFEVNLD